MSGNVFVNGGPVCHYRWDIKDAAVVCRQLFNGFAVRSTRNSEFGRVAEDFSMNYVRCTGQEEDITDCKHKTRISSLCRADRAAGVVCGGKQCRYHDYYNYIVDPGTD